MNYLHITSHALVTQVVVHIEGNSNTGQVKSGRSDW